eukprot:gene13784-15201_t
MSEPETNAEETNPETHLEGSEELLNAATPETLPELIESLRQVFSIKGVIHPPKTDADYSELPNELQEVLKVGSKWLLTGDDTFGFNLNFDGGKVMILGDEELVEEWKDDHDSPNVGEDDYELLGGYSEYDYVFVNKNPDSPDFGATRIIVNNCDDDDALTPAPFINFLKVLDRFAKDYVKTDGEDADIRSIAREVYANKRQRRGEVENDENDDDDE